MAHSSNIQRMLSTSRWSPLRCYGVAVLSVGLALAVIIPLQGVLDRGFAPPLLLAVAISALLGGTGPGLLAVALTTAAAYWVYPPFGHFANESGPDAIRQLLYVVSAVPIALLGSAIRQASIRAEAESLVHQHTETALRASEARFRGVFESHMIGIAFWNGERITDANEALLRLLGYDRADLEQGLLRHGRLTPPEYEAADRRATEEVLARGVCTPYEKEFFRKDGTRVPVLAGGALFGGELPNGVFFVLDISERRRAEEHLQAAQRLETAGRLAGGIAHEANNQMLVVLGAAHFLLQRPGLPADLREDVEHIRRAAEHTAAITRQLLAFSRQQLLQPRRLDLNIEVERLASVIRRTLGPGITLVLRLEPDSGQVRVDPGQLSQVLLNLVLNARDAMPSGGEVTIKTGQTRLGGSGPARFGESLSAGSYATLTVSDTGHGMDHETLSRVFEPFFTTKPIGEGTGLGLSTVHGIVRQSGGDLSVESVPDRGTRFTIYLPQTTVPADAPVSSAGGSGLPEHRGERLPNAHTKTILVVDDQEQVRAMQVRALQMEGYTVLEAGTPDEALRIMMSDGLRLDLVITDLIMPEMTGSELARRVTERWPGVPILYTSGHASDEVLRRGLLAAGEPFIQKPYAPDVLVAAVRRLLSGSDMKEVAPHS